MFSRIFIAVTPFWFHSDCWPLDICVKEEAQEYLRSFKKEPWINSKKSWWIVVTISLFKMFIMLMSFDEKKRLRVWFDVKKVAPENSAHFCRTGPPWCHKLDKKSARRQNLFFCRVSPIFSRQAGRHQVSNENNNLSSQESRAPALALDRQSGSRR